MKINKRFTIFLFTSFAFFCSIYFLVNIDDVYARTYDNRTIKVVIDENYPPYSFRDAKGALQGISIDQWRLFEKKTGIKVEIKGMEWNKAFQAMKMGEFDVIDTISYNEERDGYLDYTEPYATIEVPIFFNKNITGIANVESLKGFTVGAKKGDNAINELTKHGITDIKVYDSAERVIQAAKDQELVVFVMGMPPSLYYMYRMGIQDRFNYASSLYTSKFYRAVNEGNKELLNALNQGFAKISRKEYKQIEEKWFGHTYPSVYNTRLFKTIIMYIALILFIVISLIIWNRSLHLRVKRKTKELSDTVRELQTSETRVRALLEAIPDIFFLFDNKGTIIDYHAMQDDQLYMEPSQFVGKTVGEIFPESLSGKFMNAINSAIILAEIKTIEYSLDMSREKRSFEARLVAYGCDRIVGIVRDITERKKSEEKLIEMGKHDSLTGLFNRHCFENEIITLNMTSKNSLFVAMFDLDGLKLINDTMGHVMGDKYLIAASKLIIKSFPEDCFISRIGGDEFCAILVDKSRQEIDEYVRIFNENIINYNNGEHVIQISISLGYVYIADEVIDVNEMIKEADNRMYRVKLHRRQSMKSEVVQTMKNMLEARDFITEGHANRMEELAVKLAKAIGIPDKDIADIRLLAQFHDIGKVGIPDHILFKPSKLTDEEFEIMKRHTEIGHRIAEASIDLLPIADFILKHHERWDGKGYPFGIEGTKIPVECRILAIVDAYDAMTNDRPYRKAIPKTSALNELKRCSSTQFDPLLVSKFMELYKINE